MSPLRSTTIHPANVCTYTVFTEAHSWIFKKSRKFRSILNTLNGTYEYVHLVYADGRQNRSTDTLKSEYFTCSVHDKELFFSMNNQNSNETYQFMLCMYIFHKFQT